MMKFVDVDLVSKAEDAIGSALAVLFEEAATRAVRAREASGGEDETLTSLAQDALVLAAALAIVRARFGAM